MLSERIRAAVAEKGRSGVRPHTRGNHPGHFLLELLFPTYVLILRLPDLLIKLDKENERSRIKMENAK